MARATVKDGDIVAKRAAGNGLADRMAAIRRCQACAADDADIGAFDHGLPHDLGTGCDFTERDLCKHGDGRVGNHAFHGKKR